MTGTSSTKILGFWRFLSCFVALFLFLVEWAQADAPKNIIIMISDGAGFNHVDAASLYQYGETGRQVYEDFPVKLAMSTYPFGGGYVSHEAWQDFEYVMEGYTDSAAAATAMSAGVKTRKGALGVTVKDLPLRHLMALYEEEGKMSGVVTSVPFSHATPAGFVAHNTSRHNYAAIAREMLQDSALDVIMGCGHPYFDPDGRPVKEGANTFDYVGGRETWERLVDADPGNDPAGDADGDGKPDPWALVQTRAEFENLISGPTPSRVLGIPKVFQTLQQRRSGQAHAAPFEVTLIDSVPTLAEMTRAALNILDADPDGFVLMVEGGAVDWAAHDNQSGRMVEEQIDFNRSVAAVVDWVESHSSWQETLLIVTADHECGYLCGPDSGKEKPYWRPLVNNGPGRLPGMEWHSGDHTNSLVPFYAKGADAEKFFKQIIGRDAVHGPYLDNTAIKRVCQPPIKIIPMAVQKD